ncbi:MAG: hypothetical protein KC561_05310 [Myxococcales bacterium]|nr:hypothetical protein [Myxococcales bacterium]
MPYVLTISVLLLLGGGVAWVFWTNRRAADLFRRLAEKHGLDLSLRQIGLYQHPVAEGALNGRPVHIVSDLTSEREARPILFVEIERDDVSSFSFSVRRNKFTIRHRDDIYTELGDPTFDQEFAVLTNDPQLVAWVFTEDMKAMFMELASMGWGPGEIAGDRDTVRFEEDGRLRTLHQYKRLSYATQILDALANGMDGVANGLSR